MSAHDAHDAHDAHEPRPAAPRPSEPSTRRADWYMHTSAASVGLEMAIAICIGAFAGQWVQENWTHWRPWTMIIGILIGVGAAGLAIVRVVREHQRYFAPQPQSPQTESPRPESPQTESRDEPPHPGASATPDPPTSSEGRRVVIRTSTLDGPTTPTASDPADTTEPPA